MASAMHTTMVKGIMAQIEEAGLMTIALKEFFTDTILSNQGKRGRSVTDDAVSSASYDMKQKKKRGRKPKVAGEKKAKTPGQDLMSQCKIYMWDECDYHNSPATKHATINNYQIVFGMCQFMKKAMMLN